MQKLGGRCSRNALSVHIWKEGGVPGGAEKGCPGSEQEGAPAGGGSSGGRDLHAAVRMMPWPLPNPALTAPFSLAGSS